MRRRLSIATSRPEDGAWRTDADPILVGKVALEAGIALTCVLGMILSLLIGFMLGVFFRSSTGAIVA